jgi:hypothetical protein
MTHRLLRIAPRAQHLSGVPERIGDMALEQHLERIVTSIEYALDKLLVGSPNQRATRRRARTRPTIAVTS